MYRMFLKANKFNQPLNFDTSNITCMENMFYCAESFNQPLNFDTSNVTNMKSMFYNARAFLDRYNNGASLPDKTEDIKEWININRDRMNAIDVKENQGKDITDIHSMNGIGLHDDFFTNITNLRQQINKNI